MKSTWDITCYVMLLKARLLCLPTLTCLNLLESFPHWCPIQCSVFENDVLSSTRFAVFWSANLWKRRDFCFMACHLLYLFKWHNTTNPKPFRWWAMFGISALFANAKKASGAFINLPCNNLSASIYLNEDPRNMPDFSAFLGLEPLSSRLVFAFSVPWISKRLTILKATMTGPSWTYGGLWDL